VAVHNVHRDLGEVARCDRPYKLIEIQTSLPAPLVTHAAEVQARALPVPLAILETPDVPIPIVPSELPLY
jgi:hypothetical protein